MVLSSRIGFTPTTLLHLADQFDFQGIHFQCYLLYHLDEHMEPSQGLFICQFNSASILCTNNTNVASIPTNNVITDQCTLINNVDADLWSLGYS